jgi:hypothetical protein
MKQEDKDLLLKDLCARLPYNPLISIDGNRYRLEEIRNALIGINMYKITFDGCDIEYMNIKPYLFPLSSMTDEQRKEYEEAITYHDYIKGGWTIAKSFDDEYIIPYWFVDFCNKNHFDYRGLIEKGLAIDATNLNIY